MPAKTRRKYEGNAVATTITSNLGNAVGDTSISVTAATGWPSSGPFYVVIDPGTASEEKMLVGTISGTALSNITRGVDGTSRVSHSSGAAIYPVFTAVDADEANELTSKYENRGDIVYQGASTFETLAKGAEHTVLKAGANDPAWGLITNSNVDASAAIALSKLATGALPTGITVASANIVDGTIVDADINASAAIADTKLATISTVDKVSAPALNIVGATAIGADLADGDSIVVYDLSATANRNTALSRFAKFLFSKVSGDITVSDAGVATTKSWTTWTPTLSGLGAGTTTARFIQTGKTVHFTFRHVFTTATTVTSSTATFTLPVAARAAADLEGRFNVSYSDVSAFTAYMGFAWQTNASTVRLYQQTGVTSAIDGSQPFSWANGDIIQVSGTYEAA